MTKLLTIGVISDTHGLLRTDALAALAGVDHILHAGDTRAYRLGGDRLTCLTVDHVRDDGSGATPSADGSSGS